MTRPMNRAGKIVLISDITRSDRERLPDWHPDDLDTRGGMAVAVLALGCLMACVVALAWWAFA